MYIYIYVCTYTFSKGYRKRRGDGRMRANYVHGYNVDGLGVGGPCLGHCIQCMDKDCIVEVGST